MKIETNVTYEEVIKKQVGAIEVFLHEYCTVNGIPESKLGEHLIVRHIEEETTVAVVDVSNIEDVKFGIKVSTSENSTIVYVEPIGSYSEVEGKYPLTENYITLLKG